MTVELTLVRHGEPARDGAHDPGLSAAGREHAERAARFLAGERYHALYVSPLNRARETAAPIAATLGLTPVVVDGLAEFDRATGYVHFEDMIAAGDPRVQQYFEDDLSGWGVDAAEFTVTVRAAFDEIAARHPDERVVVVSHGGVANAFFGSVLGLTKLSFHAPAYGSVSRAKLVAGAFRLVSINERA